MPKLTTNAIVGLLTAAKQSYADTMLQLRVRRMLINRDSAALDSNYTGTLLPAPFDKTSLAIRTMLGEPAKAAQHYASRIAANRPDIAVIPTTVKSDITVTVDELAGAQERLDAALWEESGGREAQWAAGWAMSVGAVAYYLTLPRDATFGLPDREYYPELADAAGKPAVKTSHPKTGQLMYAEPGDVWAGRRKQKMRDNAAGAGSLFTLEAFPRDMVFGEKDADGAKWRAIVAEIPGSALTEGSELATAAAKYDGISVDDRGLYGLHRGPNGEIIGGITQGAPLGSNWNRAGVFTLIRFFDRHEQVILVSGRANMQGAKEVYRGPHHCTLMGVPAVPVVEVPFMRTDSNVPGQEFSTALSQVFAYIPIINQLMTLRSNATAFNLIPRWIIELPDGTVLRGEDGEPKIVESGEVPGLNPNEAAAYPGTLRQLTIATADSDALLELYITELLQKAMPSDVTSGVSGSSAAAYQVRQLIQQAQEVLRQPVDNHSHGVRDVVRMWHGWLRQLDEPVAFFPAPGHRHARRDVRSLIEFDPKNLTDSITVTQELDTPEEATVRQQMGLELLQAGAVTWEVYYEQYAKVQDPRQAVVDMYVQQVVNHVMGGTQAAPNSVIAIVADGVRGAVHYELLQQSPNYAVAAAEAAIAQQQMGPTQPTPGQPTVGGTPTPQDPQAGRGNVAAATGARQPGMGMANTLEGALGMPGAA